MIEALIKQLHTDLSMIGLNSISVFAATQHGKPRYAEVLVLQACPVQFSKQSSCSTAQVRVVARPPQPGRLL
jgi:hypothetical protein